VIIKGVVKIGLKNLFQNLKNIQIYSNLFKFMSKIVKILFFFTKFCIFSIKIYKIPPNISRGKGGPFSNFQGEGVAYNPPIVFMYFFDREIHAG